MNAQTGKPLSGDDHLAQSIADRLSTPLGTRIGRRSYGSLLPELIDQPDNALTRLRVYAGAALALQQESRLRATRFSLARTAPGSAELTITGRRTDGVAPGVLNLSVPLRALSTLSA